LYFSVVTLVTVGYGDFTPKNSNEKMYVMLLIIMGCGQQTYIINSIGNILANINKEKDEIRMKTGELDNYMIKNEVPYDLMLKARKNLEYVLTE